jgi:hypothetical protein
MTGTCHCGAVTITLADKPEYLFDCDCSNCSKHGALWGYFAPADVKVSGKTVSYTHPERERPSSNIHFCGTCGCTTHWSPTVHISQDMMGANMRLFDSEELSGIPLHFPDGKGWSGQGPFGMRRESTIF